MRNNMQPRQKGNVKKALGQLAGYMRRRLA